VKISFIFLGYSLPVMELIQEGNVALWKATMSYKIDGGKKFSSWSYKWIHGAMYTYAKKHRFNVKNLVRQRERALKGLPTPENAPPNSNHANSEIMVPHHRSQDGIDEEDIGFISQSYGLSKAESWVLLKTWQGGGFRMDSAHPATVFIPPEIVDDEDNYGDTPESLLIEAKMHAALKEQVDQAMEVLKPRDAEILRLRYLENDGISQYKTAPLVGVTRSRVSQREIIAKELLRPLLEEAFASIT